MEGPPMRLMVDPQAVSVAHHNPIPVPLHWQEGVKAGLDRDVELGVLEPVPVGEPVTWCHRMVIYDEPLTFKNSTNMLHVKHTTRKVPSTRLDLYPTGNECYRYKTAPQGYIASGDSFSRRFDEIVAQDKMH